MGNPHVVLFVKPTYYMQVVDAAVAAAAAALPTWRGRGELSYLIMVYTYYKTWESPVLFSVNSGIESIHD